MFDFTTEVNRQYPKFWRHIRTKLRFAKEEAKVRNQTLPFVSELLMLYPKKSAFY